MKTSDTIVAPATPFGIGGLAVIRLSGPQAGFIVANLCDESNASFLKPRHATLVNVHDEGGVPFDECIATYFPEPNSYTGEDIVELSCHGSPVIVQQIVARCRTLGARLAEPGEFTQRAFLNGRIDLVQAESVSALIQSQSEISSRLNYRLLQGSLSEKLKHLQEKLIELIAHVEYELDISETDFTPGLPKRITDRLRSLVSKSKALLASYYHGRLLNTGALVVIAGPPNTGKSTLLNALTDSDRAITHPIPGTTRDPIDVSLFLEGVPIRLMDTAGIRDSENAIEREGVERTKRHMRDADVVLILNDPFNNVEYINYKELTDAQTLTILNKIDLLNKSELKTVKVKMGADICLSALHKIGITALKNRLREMLKISPNLSSNVCLTTERQRDALETFQKHLVEGLALLDSKVIPYELIAVNLREALEAIDRLLGKTTAEDILDNIFSHFCVGK
jgi:tRNA modification GTPase